MMITMEGVGVDRDRDRDRFSTGTWTSCSPCTRPIICVSIATLRPSPSLSVPGQCHVLMLPSVFGLSGVRYYLLPRPPARRSIPSIFILYSVFLIFQFFIFHFQFFVFLFGTSLLTSPQSSGQCSNSIQFNALQFNINGLGNADPMAISRSPFFSFAPAELIHRK